MGSRTVPFDRDATCDDCGAEGAFDFMGDMLCPKCADKVLGIETDEMLD